MSDAIAPGAAIGDQLYMPKGGAVLWPLRLGYPVHLLLPNIGTGWSVEKDRLLRATVRLAPMWGGAFGKAAAAMAAADWSVEDSDDSTRRTSAAQQLLHAADGGGWASAIERSYRDYATTGNGTHWRVLRVSNARGAKVCGLIVLDSLRCWRTGLLDYPIMYSRLDGTEELLADWEVFSLADMPDPDAEHMGIGLCAAERAYRRIQLETAMDLYDHEKLTGTGFTKLVFLSGVMDTQLQNILQSGEATQQAKGVALYRGALLATTIMDGGVTVTEVDLKGTPDGFNREAERSHTAAVYGNVLNMAISDVAPLREGLGAGGQAKAQAQANAGDIRAVFRKKLAHRLNHVALPTTTVFSWSTNDTADKKAQAELAKVEIDGVLALVKDGVITPAQAQQLLVDKQLLPPEFLTAPDQTPGDMLSDDQKPMTAP